MALNRPGSAGSNKPTQSPEVGPSISPSGSESNPGQAQVPVKFANYPGLKFASPAEGVRPHVRREAWGEAKHEGQQQEGQPKEDAKHQANTPVRPFSP